MQTLVCEEDRNSRHVLADMERSTVADNYEGGVVPNIV